MVTKQFEMRIPLSPQICYEILQEEIGARTGWESTEADPSTYTLAWKSGGGIFSGGKRSIRVALMSAGNETVVVFTGKNTAKGSDASSTLEKDMLMVAEYFRQGCLGHTLRNALG